jgi:phosphatidate cytidylyltransferase
MISSHRKRILTSLILLPVLAGALFMGGWFLFALILAAALLGLREFYAMFWQRGTRCFYKITGYTAGAALLLAGAYNAHEWMLGIMLISFWAASLSFLTRYGSGDDSARFQDALCTGHAAAGTAAGSWCGLCLGHGRILCRNLLR